MAGTDDSADELAATALASAPAPSTDTADATAPVVGPTLELPGDRAAPRRALGEGAVVGHFRLGPVLGEGGMGVVHEAYDPDLDRKVAIKLVRHRAADTAAGRRLIREAQAMARLAHPGVVAVHEVGTIDDQVFVVMERLSGGTLDTYLAAAPRTWRVIVDRFLEAGEGLAAAHAAGLVHRDFKPSNVLLDDHGRAKVTDFGIARLSGDAVTPTASPLGEDVAATGAVVGTPAYMAPEQARGEPVDPRADQYAFAVALHEALFGARPGEPASTGASRRGAVDRARLPRVIRRAVDRALADAPAARWPTMAAFVARLRRGRHPSRFLGLGALTAALLAALTAVAVRGVTPPPAARCDDGGALLDELWGPAQQRAIAAAFTATGRPHAPTTVRTTHDTVDDWGAGWRLARGAACHADPVDRARRLACLDRALGQLRAQLTEWATADGTTADAAIAAAAALPLPTTCADQIRAPAPAAGLAPLLARLDVLEARHHDGHTAELRAEAVAAVADAERAGDLIVLARARTVAADVTFASDSAGARALYLRAARAAGDAGDDRGMLAALLRAAQAESDAGRPLATLASLDTLEPLIARARQGDLDATLAVYRGQALLRAGDGAGAVATLARAVAFSETRATDDVARTDELALALALEANALSITGQRPAAKPLLVRALALQELRYGPAHPVVARTLGDLSALEANLGDLAAAAQHHARALDILTRTYGPDHVLVAKLHLSAGDLAAAGGDPAASLAEFQLALPALRRLEGEAHPDVAYGLLGVGTALRDLARYAEAVPAFEQALALTTKAGTGGEPLARIEQGLGACLMLLGHDGDAARHLQAAIDAFERAGLHGDDLAEPLTNLAAIAERGRRFADELTYAERALKAIGEPTDATRALHDALVAGIPELRKRLRR